MDPVQGKITDLLEPEAEKRILAMRQPGIEPGSTAWKAAMLTTIPPTLRSRSGGALNETETPSDSNFFMHVYSRTAACKE